MGDVTLKLTVTDNWYLLKNYNSNLTLLNSGKEKKKIKKKHCIFETDAKFSSLIVKNTKYIDNVFAKK